MKKAPLEAMKASKGSSKKVAPKRMDYSSPGLSVTPQGYPTNKTQYKKSIAPNKPK